MKTSISLLFCFLAILSCRNSDKRLEIVDPIDKDTVVQKVNPIVVDTSETRPCITQPVDNKNRHERLQVSYVRYMEGVSDNKLNGEIIIIQMDLAKSEFDNNPDTIEHFLNDYYSRLEPYFPRSIADDFENGISTERIHYPTLSFTVELFENEFAAKPYKTVNKSINGKIDIGITEDGKVDPVYENVDQMPTIFEGNQEIRVYLQENVTFPAEDIYESISGISWLSFIVEKDGSVTDIKIEKEFSECLKCDAEALKVAKSLPLLNPGKQNGQIVRVRILQGIRF